MDSQPASQQPPLGPPSIPPRPSRGKTPTARVAAEGQSASAGDGTSAAAGTAGVPMIPPRPSRNKSPFPPTAGEEANIDPGISTGQPPLSPCQSTPLPPEEDVQDQSESEPVTKATATIPSDMEVHAPIARSTGVIPPNRPGFLRSTSLGTSTPPRQVPKGSNDTGIPEIGRQVPMYPNAGDVQAPTPNPSRQPSTVPAHTKKGPRSVAPQKEDYGEYGSGLHPLERRGGHYSMSSDDLNQIVAQTATPNFPGVPEEELGYLASEEYAKAIGTATPREELTEAEANKLHKINSGESTQTREGSQSPELTIHIQPRAHERSGSHPYGRHNLLGKFSQSQASLPASLVDTGDLPEEEGEFRDEHFSGTPILASDEITKRGGTSTPHYHPAVSPPLGPRRTGSKPASRAPSRPPSRGAMREPVAPGPLPDVEEHEPLFPEDDEVKESQTALREGVEKAFAGRTSRSSRKFPSNDIWEDAPPSSHLSATVASPPPGLSPLGLDSIAARDKGAPVGEPQDEESDRLGVPNRHKKGQSPDDEQSKPLRPAVLTKTSNGKQRFPSKDIWEEAPDSAQLTATVSPTPANEESQSPVDTTAPEVTFPPNTTSTRATTGAHLDQSNLHVNPDERTSTLEAKKPEVPDRSPSPEKKEKWGPTGAVPLVPSTRPAPRAAKIPTKFDTQEQIEQAQRPSAVPRTSSSESPTEKKAPPVLPERPKPIIPQRPAKAAAKFQQSPLSQSEEASSSVKAPPPVKPKPAIGGKIAALKANLALEQKLAAGPLTFKKKEEEEKSEATPEEPKPLVEDVRKSRAKGPRGRKLPTAAAPAATAPEEAKEQKEEEEEEGNVETPALSFMIAKTVWSIDDEDDARVVLQEAEESSPKEEEVIPELEVDKLSEATDSAQKSLAKQVYTEMVDPPVVDKPSEEEPPHKVNTGMIAAETHPEDAAPKGQSSLDTEKPAHAPAEKESTQAEAGQAVEEEGDGDWDVVNRV